MTVYAAFQRAKVYSDTADNDHKRGVKQTLENEINARLSKYTRAVSENAHVQNIEVIAKIINKQWSPRF